MDIFITWSGPKSLKVAEALHKWLPKIVNAFQPWLSSADIDSGARWDVEVAKKLESASAGIICLTPGNLHSDWILFESGALAKTVQSTFVCPLLIALEPSEVKQPLSKFQADRLTKDGVFHLVKTLRKALPQDAAIGERHVEEMFELLWPRLEEDLADLPEEQVTAGPTRTDRDLLEELLELVRSLSRGSGPEVSDSLDIVINAAKFVDPGIYLWTTRLSGGNYFVELRTKRGKQYTLVIAEEALKGQALKEQIAAIVASQMASQ